MTSKELFNKIKPSHTETYLAQLLSDGLSVNLSDMFSKFVKDAARCNGYNSDIFYDMILINDTMKQFKHGDEVDPIWVGFRKLGVDGTNYILSRCNTQTCYKDLSRNYFALYSVTIDQEDGDFYHVNLHEYAV